MRASELNAPGRTGIMLGMDNLISHGASPTGTTEDTANNANIDRTPGRSGLRPLRVVGRPDVLTAQKVEVAIILQAMLGTIGAAEYLADNAIAMSVSLRVLTQPERRRGLHDDCGVRRT
jgi:hypothetical protein